VAQLVQEFINTAMLRLPSPILNQFKKYIVMSRIVCIRTGHGYKDSGCFKVSSPLPQKCLDRGGPSLVISDMHKDVHSLFED